MRRITIEDVAREAGVSRQTVSRAINDKGEISSDTRDRVLSVVERLGYRPNRLAQGMVTQRTQIIGLEVPDITNPVFAEISRGIQEVAQVNGYNLLLANSDDEADVARQIALTFAAQGVDGMIGLLGALSDEEVRSFADTFRPIVLINHEVEHPNVSSVKVDIYKGAVLAVTSLVQQGHTTIGMLANIASTHVNTRRLQGYKDTLQRHDLPIDKRLIAYTVPTLEGGYQAAKHLLTAQPRITAIFAYNDLMAIGALRACRDLGRRVPADCSIIGFDDIALTSMTTPSLTTVRYDKRSLGKHVMGRVLEMIAEPEHHFAPIELGIELVLRESTASPGRKQLSDGRLKTA